MGVRVIAMSQPLSLLIIYGCVIFLAVVAIISYLTCVDRGGLSDEESEEITQKMAPDVEDPAPAPAPQPVPAAVPSPDHATKPVTTELKEVMRSEEEEGAAQEGEVKQFGESDEQM